jgi:DNA polymerase-3 subunit alpha
MGKKDREEMAKQREKFQMGALKNGIDAELAIRIYEKIEKFASYGFNKSHAAAYGYLTYVTAYLKANFCGEWMAALMTCDRDDVTKIARFIAESQTMGISILPPDVNEAGKEFVAAKSGIRFAMSAIKGVGEGVVDAIIEERTKSGPFRSLYDFFKRIDIKRVGKKSTELLIEAGAFDFTTWSRQELFLMVEPIFEAAQRLQKEQAQGILNLFSLIEEDDESRFLTPPAIAEPIPLQKILKREKELLGFYLTGHPMDAYKEAMQRLSCVPLEHFEQLDHDAVVRAAFIIEEINIKISQKSQKKFAILVISNGCHRYELPIWSELFEEKSQLLLENQLIYAVLQIDKKEEEIKLQCRWFDDLTQVNDAMIQMCDLAFEKAKLQAKGSGFRERNAQNFKNREQKKVETGKLIVLVNAEKVRLSHILELKKIFRDSPGSMPIEVHFQSNEEKMGIVAIEGKWGIHFEKDLEQKISKIESIKTIEVTA